MGLDASALVNGVGGSLGGQSASGVAIGAAVGSIVPGVGTLLGAGIGAVVGAFVPAGQKYPSMGRTFGRFFRAGAPEWFGRVLYAAVLREVSSAGDRQQLAGAAWDASVSIGAIPTQQGGTSGYATGAPVPVRKDDGLSAWTSSIHATSGPAGTAVGSVDWIRVAKELRLVETPGAAAAKIQLLTVPDNPAKEPAVVVAPPPAAAAPSGPTDTVAPPPKSSPLPVAAALLLFLLR